MLKNFSKSLDNIGTSIAVAPAKLYLKLYPKNELGGIVGACCALIGSAIITAPLYLPLIGLSMAINKLAKSK